MEITLVCLFASDQSFYRLRLVNSTKILNLLINRNLETTTKYTILHIIIISDHALFNIPVILYNLPQY